MTFLEPAAQTDLRNQGVAALVAGDHPEMARVFTRLGEAANTSSDDLCWLGHAHQLAGDWPSAAAAYAAALAKMDEELAEVPASPRPSPAETRIRPGSREEQLKKRCNLVLMLARIQRHLLEDSRAAAMTYAMVTNHSVTLALPMDDLATEWETRRAALRDTESQARTPPPNDINLYFSLPVLRELAETQEELGDLGGALKTWRRIQLTKNTYFRMGYPEDFPAITRLMREQPLVPSEVPPGIILLTGEAPSFTFDLHDPATQALSTGRNNDKWTFCLAPPAGMEFNELEFACDIEQFVTNYSGQLECWTLVGGENRPRQIHFGYIGWDHREGPGRAIRSRRFKIPPGVGSVYFRSGSLAEKYRVHEVKVGATLRARQADETEEPSPGFSFRSQCLPEGGIFELDGKARPANGVSSGLTPGWHRFEYTHGESGRGWSIEANFLSGAEYGLFVNLDSPFVSKLTNLRGLEKLQASLAQRKDGRWMLTWESNEGTIRFAESEDLVTWSEPWELAESRLFGHAFSCNAPSLFSDTDGRLWLAYFSNRLDLVQRNEDEGHRLFLSYFDENHEWSPPRPLPLRANRQQFDTRRLAPFGGLPFGPVRMSRDSQGTFRIMHRLRESTAEGPAGKFSDFIPLQFSRDASLLGGTANSNVAHHADSRHHMVWGRRDRMDHKILYSRREHDGTWSEAREIQGLSGMRPQLIADGNRVLLVYEQSNGAWMAPLRFETDGPHAGEPVKITDNVAPLFFIHVSEEDDGLVILLCGSDTVWVRSAQRKKLFQAFFPEESP